MKKLVALLILVAFVFIIFSDLTIYATLENIKASHDKWVALYLEHPVRIISMFMIFNIFMAMLPVPGISMISFLGGSIFGFFPGVIYSSIATAIGNLGGFFIGRYLLRDFVYIRYGDKLIVFKDDWKREGALALFSFRLFPFIPSFVANLIMGVSNLWWWTFFWVSWVGRIPMVLVYTWGGVQIAKIESLVDILSPGVISAFILLGSLPWIFKFILKKLNVSS